MKELTLYRCEVCGNLIYMIEDSGVVPVCCGEEMTRINANTEDAVEEKHVPVVQRDGSEVCVLVGRQPHPMLHQHYISRIALLTDRGAYVRRLSPDSAAEAVFRVCKDEKLCSAYAWCNIHGLWRKELKQCR